MMMTLLFVNQQEQVQKIINTLPEKDSTVNMPFVLLFTVVCKIAFQV